MRHKDVTGETYYLIPVVKNGYDAFRIYPWNADIARAHIDAVQMKKDIKTKKERNKSYAV